MSQRLIRRAALLLVFAGCGISGCGTTGSDPILFPEVRFEVRPSGQATFTVDALSGGGESYTSVIGQQFTATAPFDFALENAGSPFEGLFRLIGVCSNNQAQCSVDSECAPAGSCDLGGQQITVTLTVISGINQTQVSDATAPGKPTAMVAIGALPAGVTPLPAHPEVRFDVCAPLPGRATCSTKTGDGTFGALFSGSFGDPFISYLTSGATPTIYFYRAPQSNINSVLTRLPLALLGVQLFINGELKETQVGSGEVIISQDL